MQHAWLSDCVHAAMVARSDRNAFDPYRGAELAPGAEVRTDPEIDAWVAQRAETAYHPAGTCRMGTDLMAVVDPQCRVRGIESLRVVDTSVMPTVTNGNLNAPTIMIGEKAADHILDRAPLEPLTTEMFGAPDWQGRARDLLKTHQHRLDHRGCGRPRYGRRGALIFGRLASATTCLGFCQQSGW